MLRGFRWFERGISPCAGSVAVSRKLVVRVVKHKERLTAGLWPPFCISALFQIIKDQKPAALLAAHFQIIACPVPLSLSSSRMLLLAGEKCCTEWQLEAQHHISSGIFIPYEKHAVVRFCGTVQGGFFFLLRVLNECRNWSDFLKCRKERQQRTSLIHSVCILYGSSGIRLVYKIGTSSLKGWLPCPWCSFLSRLLVSH